MNLKNVSLGLVVLLSFGSLAGRAEEGGEHSKPLVPELLDLRRPEKPSAACAFKDALSKDVPATESEALVTKLLFSMAFLAERYETVRNAPEMQTIPLEDGRLTPYVRKLIQGHDIYMRSSQSSPDSGPTSPIVTMHLTPAAAALGGMILALTARYAPYQNQASVKGGGNALFYSGVSVFSSAASGRSLGFQVMPMTSKELTIEQQRQLAGAIDEQLAAPSEFLAETLHWNASEKARFAQALRRRSVEAMKKTLTGMEMVQQPIEGTNGGAMIKIVDPKIAGSLGDVDFLDVIASEGLASEPQVHALRAVQNLYNQVTKISSEMTPTQAKELFSKEQSVTENLKDVARLQRLLTQVEKQMDGKSEAKAAVQRLIQQSTKGVESITKLCDLGLN